MNDIKKAIFLDNNGETQTAMIHYIPDYFINIQIYNQNQENVGYMVLFFHYSNRIFLDVVYCYSKFRGNGISSMMSNIVDYLLRDYSGYIIRGVYQPSQLSTDREEEFDCGYEELNLRARNFYRSCGYSVVSYQEYQEDPFNYSILNQEDFELGEEFVSCIVVKQLQYIENHPFSEVDEVIIDNNILNANVEKKKYIQKYLKKN